MTYAKEVAQPGFDSLERSAITVQRFLIQCPRRARRSRAAVVRSVKRDCFLHQVSAIESSVASVGA
jgi:hypothetical protein